MEKKLPENGINCVVVKRKEILGGNGVISASEVRKKIKDGKIEDIKNMVPDCTYKFFISEEGKNVVDKIKKMDDSDIKHY